MRSSLRLYWLVPLTALLLAATPELTPEDYVRQGNAAFERADYEEAVKLYNHAEERITNPGLVAYNKATALYHLRDFRGAEVHYRRCLEDATDGRRAAMLYNLGNCLLQESRGDNADQLKKAMACYDLCMKQEGAPDQVRADARHNLELAKLLWFKARQNRPNKEPGTNPDEPKEPPPDPKKPTEEKKTPSGNPDPGPNENPMAKGQPQPDPHDQRTPLPTKEAPPPGSGNLPPIPDKGELPPMSPEDAAAHLQRAAERILRERRQHQLHLAPAARKDIPEY